MDYIYSQLCQNAKSIDYEGLKTDTAEVVVDNNSRTISVNVTESSPTITPDNLESIIKAGTNISIENNQNELIINCTIPEGPVGPQGEQGIPGRDGAQGPKGDKGNTGEIGPVGPIGPEGPQGVNGKDGTNGVDGAPGKSAYEIAQEQGFTGTEAEWLASLKGADGKNGVKGAKGADGKSAYQIWLDQGNSGTEEDFLNWLRNPISTKYLHNILIDSRNAATNNNSVNLSFLLPNEVSTPYSNENLAQISSSLLSLTQNNKNKFIPASGYVKTENGDLAIIVGVSASEDGRSLKLDTSSSEFTIVPEEVIFIKDIIL